MRADDVLGSYICINACSVKASVIKGCWFTGIFEKGDRLDVVFFNMEVNKVWLVDVLTLTEKTRHEVDIDIEYFLRHFRKIKTVKESDIGDELDALIKEAQKKHEGDYAEVERANRRIAAVEEALSKMTFNSKDKTNIEITVQRDSGPCEVIAYSPHYKCISLAYRVSAKDASAKDRLFISSKLEELMKEAIKHIK